MPSRFTKVSVYNLNDLSTPPGDTTHGNPPDQLLGETVTYPDGSWYLHDVPLTDVDGTRPDVYVIYHATNASSFGQMRSVRNMNSEVYKFPLKSAATTWWDYPSPGDPGAPPLIDDLLGTGTTDLPALWLLDDANRAYMFVQGYAFKDPGQVHLYWALGDDWSGLCGSVSCFGPITGSPNGFGAFIQDAIRDMPDVAVHEIAHAYRHSLTRSWVSSCPGTHYAWWVTNPQCAWEEGWADFLPTVINGDPCYDDNTNYGPCDPLMPDANLENPTWGDNKSTGGSVEGRVAGALLDIHDAAGFPPEADDEGWDNTNRILSLTWKVLDPATEGNSESTITDFWRHWNGYHGPATHSITGPLYQSTITTHVFIPMFQ